MWGESFDDDDEDKNKQVVKYLICILWFASFWTCQTGTSSRRCTRCSICGIPSSILSPLRKCLPSSSPNEASNDPRRRSIQREDLQQWQSRIKILLEALLYPLLISKRWQSVGLITYYLPLANLSLSSIRPFLCPISRLLFDSKWQILTILKREAFEKE